MRYIEFRDTVMRALRARPTGLTWTALRNRLNLPYDRPCPTWVRRMEEVGLVRTKGPGRELVWKARGRR